MVHRITLPAPLEEKLRERAAASGTDAETFILEAVAEKLQTPKSFREIFAPLHQAFGEAPIGEDELAALVDRAREDRYRRVQESNSKSS